MPVIATNTSANTALFYLNRNSTNQSNSLAKISSGSRIVSSADDAAGLAVADQLQADITALEVASRTTQQANALLQTADGGAARIGDILQRMKALGTQYASGTLDTTSQGFINDEFAELRLEIDLIVASTEYNGNTLIDGTFDNAVTATLVTDILVGTDGANHTIDIGLAAVDLDVAALTVVDANFPTAAGFTVAGITNQLIAIDAAISEVGTSRATLGALTSAVQFQGENVETQLANLKAAKSTISDVDIAAEQTNFTNFQVLTEAAISGLSKSNEMKQSLLSLLR